MNTPDTAGPPGGLKLTVSLGVATFIPGENLTAALKRADAALYAAKRSGRNRVVLAETLASLEAPARRGTVPESAQAEPACPLPDS